MVLLCYPLPDLIGEYLRQHFAGLRADGRLAHALHVVQSGDLGGVLPIALRLFQDGGKFLLQPRRQDGVLGAMMAAVPYASGAFAGVESLLARLAFLGGAAASGGGGGGGWSC